MRGHTIRLGNDFARERAVKLILTAPQGAIVNVSLPNRTTAQNAKMWAMLSDISRCQPMGRRHTPDDWKALAMNACGWECQFCEGLDGRPFPIGFKSSNLSKEQMSALVDWLQAFGDEHGVIWSNRYDSED